MNPTRKLLLSKDGQPAGAIVLTEKYGVWFITGTERPASLRELEYWGQTEIAAERYAARLGLTISSTESVAKTEPPNTPPQNQLSDGRTVPARPPGQPPRSKKLKGLRTLATSLPPPGHGQHQHGIPACTAPGNHHEPCTA